MITEKSKNKLRRATAWLMIWKGYADEDRKNNSTKNMDSEPAENIYRLALHEIEQLTEDWQITEALEGRR